MISGKASDSGISSDCTLLAAILVFLAAAACSAALWAGEKNGVSPNTVSLPSGAGTIEGLGAIEFEPTTFCPPVRNQFAYCQSSRFVISMEAQ